MPHEPIAPARVRYIKLGEGGKWEQGCLRDGINRIGFGTADPQLFDLCVAHRWDDLQEAFIASGRTPSTARRFTNEIKVFFEDSGDVLWITFIGENLFWALFDESPVVRAEDKDGVVRRMAGGWRNADLGGESLTKDRLSGALTKLTMYRGTSCEVRDVKDYVVRRINGVKSPEVEAAIKAASTTKTSILPLLRLLEPRDFEILVDLIFTTSGWRRLGVVGGVEKTRDLDLQLPSTGERAFVQVKSRTNQSELEEYIGRIEQGPWDRMFFVYHTGEVETDDARVRLVGPELLATMIFEAGLVEWLIRKVQ